MINTMTVVICTKRLYWVKPHFNADAQHSIAL